MQIREYWSLLLAVFASPGTGSTVTLSGTSVPNELTLTLRKLTAFVSPGLMMSITFFFVIGCGLSWRVSVTATCVSWLSPEFLTRTWKPRRSEAVTVFSSLGERACFAGRTRTATI